ncbi:uncharacterized protein TNCV_1218421 [Trichonephila clavipes]|nr:uncharacterized protein TNCV_1218421 [Trichonephila clavipes]
MWASDHPQSVLALNWGGTEPNRTATCMVLKATTNNRRHLALCHDEFRGPPSGLCRSGSTSNKNRFSKFYSSFLAASRSAGLSPAFRLIFNY